MLKWTRPWACLALAIMLVFTEFPECSARPVFRVEGGDSVLTAKTLEVLHAVHREMADASGRSLEDTIRLIYVPASQSFDSVIGGRFPDWGVAAAIGTEHLIVVRSPADHPLGRELTSILRHELAHLHLSALVGQGLVPRWMQEGYAQHFGHQWQYGDDWTVARAMLTGRTLPLRDIDGVNSFQSASAQLAYAQSYLALGYLLEAYGWKSLLIFGDQVGGGANWDEAFLEAIGTDYAGFQHEFNEYLRSRYNWASFLGDTAVLWVALVCAFVIFYIVKRRRTRRRLEEMQREDEWMDRLYGGYDSHWAIAGDEPKYTARIRLCPSH